MTFSGDVEKLDIVSYIETQLKYFQLVLNVEKSKLMLQNERQIVTGLVVNKVIQIPKTDRNFIRNEVHYLTKFGLVEHLVRTKNTRANYLIHLLGKINFALQINSKDMKMQGYKQKVTELMAKQAG
jgi:RNA-directed DNA polymerase